MVILFLYDLDDMGVFAQSRVKSGVTAPILQQYQFIPLSVRKLSPRRRMSTIRRFIDKTDLLAIVTGTYTFMRPWAIQAAVYGFSKNRPMMAINEVNIYEGWSNELENAPSPFVRVQWVVRGHDIQLNALDNVFEVFWRPQAVVPSATVHYRLHGQNGLLDEIAPRYDWALDDANRNFPKWVQRSVELAGL